MTAPRSRRILARTGLVLLSLCLGLGIVEWALRRTALQLVPYRFPDGYHVADPHAGYRLARGFPETLIESKGGTRDLCVTSSLGVRDVEIPAGQDPRKVVLILGASLTYGWGATRLDETWPRRLNREIRDRFPRYADHHFVNAGVSGYNHFQAVSLYRELLEEIEVGIAILVHTDLLVARNLWGPDGKHTVFADTLMLTQFERKLRGLPSSRLGVGALDGVHDWLLLRLRTYFSLSSYLARRETLADAARGEPLELAYATGEAALDAAFGEFRDVSRENGVTPLIAYLPMARTFRDRSPVETEAVGRRVAESLGLPFLDPKPRMRRSVAAFRTPAEALTHGHDTHYSPRGNAIYSKALAPLVVAHLRSR